MNPAVLDAFALAISAAAAPPAFPGIPGHEPDIALARRNARHIGARDGRAAQAGRRTAAPTCRRATSSSPTGSAPSGARTIARLRRSRRKYDPDGLFFVHHGVGSEDWSADGFTRLR